jgi:hypothetical protein
MAFDIEFRRRLTCTARRLSAAKPSGRSQNEMLNGEVIRLDGAIRMAAK